MTVAESMQSIPASDDASIMVYQWNGSVPARGSFRSRTAWANTL
jgi:hypothetical protein